MNMRQIRDLALKILGIYYLSHALTYALQFAGVFTSWGKISEIAGNEFAVLLSVLLPLLFWVVIGLVLTFRTSLVAAILWAASAEDQPAPATARPSLRFWVVLVGFFFLVKSLGGAVSQLWVFAASQQMRGSFSYYRSLPELITLALSIVCIAKAQAIEALLMTKIEKDSPPTPGGDSATRADAGPGTPQE